jgi:hypothetical protein
MPDYDLTVPAVSRAYDYATGGKDNFAADREMAEEILKVSPAGARAAHDNRAFILRAVSEIAAGGVRQFIDIGCGFPIPVNVHHTAFIADPGARVAYVDNDPVVVNHAIGRLQDSPYVVAVRGDLREPGEILADPALRVCIDLEQPVAVILGSVLHFLSDQEASRAVAEIRQAVLAGSYLVISHATADGHDEAGVDKVRHVYRERAGATLTLRTRDQVTGFFDGFTLIEPGVVSVRQWRPHIRPASTPALLYGGVAVKPVPAAS